MWGSRAIVRDDFQDDAFDDRDFGYPRLVQRPDGKLAAVHLVIGMQIGHTWPHINPPIRGGQASHKSLVVLITKGVVVYLRIDNPTVYLQYRIKCESVDIHWRQMRKGNPVQLADA